MDDLRSGLAAWLRQQVEGGAPDMVLSHGCVSRLFAARGAAVAPVRAERQAVPSPLPAAPAPRPVPPAGGSATARRLKPIRDLQRLVAGSTREPGSDYEAKREELKKLYYEAKGCERCPLARTRSSVVFGSGSVDAPVLAIGEAPGAEEDAQGLPFVGAAGKLLSDMLAAIGLDRTHDVFIANVLKCRPPQNRNPESSEMAACLPFLKRQIDIIRPRALLLLGRTAAGALLDNPGSVGSLRKQVHQYQGIPAVVTYHPAALLRDSSYKRPAWEDLKRLAQMLKDMGINGSIQH